MGLATDKINEIMDRNQDSPGKMEQELQALFGILPAEVQAMQFNRTQEEFCELLASKINEKLNPPPPDPEEQRKKALAEFYPSHKDLNKPAEYNPDKSWEENFYNNSPRMFGEEE